MKCLVPLLLIAGLATSAFGCVGDTEEALVKRYGRQMKTGTSHLPGVTIRGFYFGGFMVVVGVMKERSAYEMYSKRDGTKISPNDLTALMNANSGGKPWAVDTTTKPETSKWVTEDHSMVAEWNKAAATLTVMTAEAADLEANTPTTPANTPKPTPTSTPEPAKK